MSGIQIKKKKKQTFRVCVLRKIVFLIKCIKSKFLVYILLYFIYIFIKLLKNLIIVILWDTVHLLKRMRQFYSFSNRNSLRTHYEIKTHFSSLWDPICESQKVHLSPFISPVGTDECRPPAPRLVTALSIVYVTLAVTRGRWDSSTDLIGLCKLMC